MTALTKEMSRSGGLEEGGADSGQATAIDAKAAALGEVSYESAAVGKANCSAVSSAQLSTATTRSITSASANIMTTITARNSRSSSGSGSGSSSDDSSNNNNNNSNNSGNGNGDSSNDNDNQHNGNYSFICQQSSAIQEVCQFDFSVAYDPPGWYWDSK
ncbi:hypothetical protein AK812_SmicGene40285 [Symbiodinium microadriaticum]|uniref:Uncharacterized protein n=1 Tax=Symbiodinium microadriaticum TaxID=2951 RepID=A0A1Q9C921_SYMMI|nr:hypothetical protein AK812_SmicGene40285 [Symbiodinium microadriaticum]